MADETTTDPFPTFDDGLEAVVLDDDLEDDIAQFVAEAYGFTWEFDFDAGDLSLSTQGSATVAAGIDAVKQWCRHILNTIRGESPIYDPSVGVTIEGLIGSRAKDPYVASRIKQEVVAALIQHDRIKSVVVDNLIPAGDNVFVFVTITMDTGEQIEDAIGL